MAKVIDFRAREYFLGTGYATKKVVDVTEDCPVSVGGRLTILVFADRGRERIVDVFHPADVGETTEGTHIHFFVDNLNTGTFGLTADILGLSKQELRDLIKKYAPV